MRQWLKTKSFEEQAQLWPPDSSRFRYKLRVIMATRYDNATDEEIIEQFEKAAREHGQATLAADPRTANARYKHMLKLYERLKARGMAAQRQLLSLFGSDDGYVRYWAAAQALEFDAKRAVPVLEEIFENNSGLLRFDARMTLKHWRKSRLRLE